MTRTEHLLICLAEECNEVAQRVNKALRFGLTDIQEGQELTNRQRIRLEVNDLLGVLDMLIGEGILHGPNVVALDECDGIALMRKQEKVTRYLAYAKKHGALE